VLIDMAGIRPGMRVLDLACGAGSQSIQAAKRVGPNGTVVASDISASMLEHVRRNAALAGLQNIETLDCAAEDLEEPEACFDASICRLGLMLFPSPRKALQAVRRTLKPAARFSALVFMTPANTAQGRPATRREWRPGHWPRGRGWGRTFGNKLTPPAYGPNAAANKVPSGSAFMILPPRTSQ
jgi:ubiquinone/menaquinone biosynthesis C-methylase UbiE